MSPSGSSPAPGWQHTAPTACPRDTPREALAAGLDTAQLDHQLDQRAWARDMDSSLAAYARRSRQWRASLHHQADIACGPAPAQRLDWFFAATTAADQDGPAPVVVFVHGGAWCSGSKESNSFAAGPVVAAGAHFVAIEFGQCPDTPLAEMVAQVGAAVAWVQREAVHRGGDGRRLVLAGHSSGSHLLAQALVCPDARARGLDPTGIHGAVCSSGFYDLAPVARSGRNRYLRLDAASAHQLSPLHRVGELPCPVVVCTAEGDSPLLQAQAQAFAGELARHGRLQSHLQAPGLDHFEVAETYAQPDGLLAIATRGLLARARAAVLTGPATRPDPPRH